MCRGCGGAGCAECLQTGYQGRLPAVECLPVTDAIRARLRKDGRYRTPNGERVIPGRHHFHDYNF